MKTVKTTQPSAAVKMILGILIATCAFASAANAQPIFVGKVTLPYEVRWNHAVLPAGEYFIRMDSKAAHVVLRSTSTGRLVASTAASRPAAASSVPMPEPAAHACTRPTPSGNRGPLPEGSKARDSEPVRVSPVSSVMTASG